MSVKTFVFIIQLVTIAPGNSSCQYLRFRLSRFGRRLALRFLYIPFKVSDSSPESQVNKFYPLEWQKTFSFYIGVVCVCVKNSISCIVLHGRDDRLPSHVEPVTHKSYSSTRFLQVFRIVFRNYNVLQRVKNVNIVNTANSF